MKKSFLILSVAAIVTITASDLFSHGWGRGPAGYGYCNGPGFGRGPGFNRGPGFLHGPGLGMNFRHLEIMKYELGLSENQVVKIFRIGTKFREKYFTNRNNYGKLNSLRVEHRKEIERVLNKEQREKFNTYYGFGRYGWFGGCYNGPN